MTRAHAATSDAKNLSWYCSICYSLPKIQDQDRDRVLQDHVHRGLRPGLAKCVTSQNIIEDTNYFSVLNSQIHMAFLLVILIIWYSLT